MNDDVIEEQYAALLKDASEILKPIISRGSSLELVTATVCLADAMGVILVHTISREKLDCTLVMLQQRTKHMFDACVAELREKNIEEEISGKQNS